MVLVHGILLVESFLLHAADQQPLWPHLDGNLINPGAFAIVVPFAFGIGQSLLTQELSGGTITFLDALPLHRAQVFCAKVLAAGGLLVSVPLVIVVTAGAQHALSRTSVDTELHLDLLAISLFMQAVVTAYILSVALLAGWLGRPGWMFIPMGFLLVDQQHRFPVLYFLDPARLVDPDFFGDAWVVPWGTLASQLALTFVLFLLSYAIFARRGVPGSSRLTALLGRLPWRAGVVFLLVIGSTVVCVTGSSPESGGSGRREGPIRWTTALPAAAVTASYVFHFPSDQAQPVMPLVAQADRVDAMIREFLDVRAGDPIHVDLSGSRRRTHGTAGWDKIRMVQPSQLGLERSIAVLGHETSHVYTARLSDRQMTWPVFNEGLAEYLELTLFSEPEDAERRLRYAALVHHRNKISLETAVDDAELRRRWDEDLRYPLGYALMVSLIRDHGPQRIAEILRAFGRADRPDGLSRDEAWREAFQTADVGIERMAARWDELLVEVARPHRKVWDALPTPRVEVEVGEENVELVLTDPSILSSDDEDSRPYEVWCRFRTDSGAKSQDYIEHLYFYKDRCVVEVGALSGSRFDYQVGINVFSVRGVVWEEWEEGVLLEDGGDTGGH